MKARPPPPSAKSPTHSLVSLSPRFISSFWLPLRMQPPHPYPAQMPLSPLLFDPLLTSCKHLATSRRCSFLSTLALSTLPLAVKKKKPPLLSARFSTPLLACSSSRPPTLLSPPLIPQEHPAQLP